MFAPAYLDYNASAPLHPEVVDAMLPYLGKRHGNPSSRHDYGRQARAAVDLARAQVAAAIGAHASEVVFTSGGSEANNLFLKGVAACRRAGLLAVSAIEHPCVREPARQLAAQGWELEVLAVDGQGRVERGLALQVLERRPVMMSVMLANNETGAVQDIAPLVAEARRRGCWFHTDAVQALGKLPLDFRALGVHGMSLSAHKIGGPLGAGALVLDKRVEVAPLIAGGGQERGLRSGTENVPAIVGFGAACERLAKDADGRRRKVVVLRERCEAGVVALGGTVFSAAAERLPNTLFFAFSRVDGETLVGKLDRAGYACASGSACSSADPQPSRTLLAMGIAPECARGAVRVSLGENSTATEVEGFLVALGSILEELKSMTAIAVE